MPASLILLLLAEAAVASETAKPPETTIQSGGESAYVADRNAATLYVLEGTGGCASDCLRAWPPFVAREQAKPVGDWTVISGPEGVRQWALNGRPVHTFAADGGAGRATGDGFGGLGVRWRAIRFVPAAPPFAAPAAATLGRMGSGFVLTDHAGLTLYTAGDDAAGPRCTAQCLGVWKPLRAAALALPAGEWSPVDRPDGLRQWAFRGKLVYTFDGDQKPGDTRGANAGGAWRVATYP